MPPSESPPVFVTCACAKDVHYAKALLGSVRFFYPSHQIHIILDPDVSNHDAHQLQCFPNTIVHPAAALTKKHGVALRGLLTKLHVLLIPEVTRAVFADADSLLVGPVLENIDPDCSLHCLHSQSIDLDNPRERDNFYRWAIDVPRLPPPLREALNPPFWFMQSSHFYVNKSLWPKDLLFSLLPEMSETHSPHTALRAGDQGFFNYVANAANSIGIVATHSSATLQVGQSPHTTYFDDVPRFTRAPHDEIRFLHFVGVGRRYLRRSHEYGPALSWGTRLYYDAIEQGSFLQDEVIRAARTASRGSFTVAKKLFPQLTKKHMHAR